MFCLPIMEFVCWIAKEILLKQRSRLRKPDTERSIMRIREKRASTIGRSAFSTDSRDRPLSARCSVQKLTVILQRRFCRLIQVSASLSVISCPVISREISALCLHGHNWLAQPDDPFSTQISVQGAVSVGGVYNIELENGASEYPGDYLYRSGSLKWDVESGMWGIFRVMKKEVRYCCECACRAFGSWFERRWFEK